MEQKHFIHKWRKFRGLTAEAFGEAAGIQPSMVWRVEGGRCVVRPAMLARIAIALDATADQLLNLSPLAGAPQAGQAPAPG